MICGDKDTLIDFNQLIESLMCTSTHHCTFGRYSWQIHLELRSLSWTERFCPLKFFYAEHLLSFKQATAFDSETLSTTSYILTFLYFYSIPNKRLAYIHLMAQYRLTTHIKTQSDAFIRGFQSVISPQWLGIFSGPELQRLISGSSGSVDLQDLK